VTTLARRPSPAREPDGAGHPALRGQDPAAFYAACRAFAELISGPGATVTARLSPGDCVTIDNTRIRHGRAGFTDGRAGPREGTGRRHLQGCYADLDGLASAVAVLARGRDGEAGS